jgi:hypothetical protein
LIVECHQIAQADDFKVRIVREDRKTHRTPTKVSGVSPEFMASAGRRPHNSPAILDTLRWHGFRRFLLGGRSPAD